MYEAHFGLSANPFQLTPDARFYFGSTVHNRARAYLEYGLHKGEGFVVITGEVGAGKTTLIQELLGRLDTSRIVAIHVVTTQLDGTDLLRLVARELELDIQGEDKAAVIAALRMLFQRLHADQKRVLLIVDEAQNLSMEAIEELRMLSNFQQGDKALVQSFLVGQPEFRETMQRPEMRQLQQRVVASCHLVALDEESTRQYIVHRMELVGWQGLPTIEHPVFKLIHDATNGIPRRINLLCDRLLLDCYLGQRQEIDETSAAIVIADAAAEQSDALSHPTLSSHREAVRPPAGPGPGTTAVAPDLSGHVMLLESRVQSLESANRAILQAIKRMVRLLPSPTAESVRGPGPEDDR